MILYSICAFKSVSFGLIWQSVTSGAYVCIVFTETNGGTGTKFERQPFLYGFEVGLDTVSLPGHYGGKSK